eukprot:TRINITY_DN124912_c0_g1_i1.p1 TRINITY_DN124912_c0_g1~~TRINITY_DN124912_c0_g1_i1.p1  ORF type:complete len:243 (-),score=69.88 TRINITY_DN124912_c0_g1_i1:167-895(-)
MRRLAAALFATLGAVSLGDRFQHEADPQGGAGAAAGQAARGGAAGSGAAASGGGDVKTSAGGSALAEGKRAGSAAAGDVEVNLGRGAAGPDPLDPRALGHRQEDLLGGKRDCQSGTFEDAERVVDQLLERLANLQTGMEAFKLKLAEDKLAEESGKSDSKGEGKDDGKGKDSGKTDAKTGKTSLLAVPASADMRPSSTLGQFQVAGSPAAANAMPAERPTAGQQGLEQKLNGAMDKLFQIEN